MEKNNKPTRIHKKNNTGRKKERKTNYHQYKLGDVIDGSKLDELSGGLVGNDNNQYVLIQYPLYKFPYTRQDLIDFDPEYAEEEIWRLESIKDNFDKTPPIPQEGDGLHRIIAAKELGYKTILMWKKITNLQESIRRILREETELPLYIRRRVDMEELDDLVFDVKDLIDSDYNKIDAIYDTVRQFIATKKSFKFNYDTEQGYWDSYIDVEKPLVNYVKTKLNL